jgi:hypothetical protein
VTTSSAIDTANVQLGMPVPVPDLRRETRMLQGATGYDATMCAGAPLIMGVADYERGKL